MCRHSMIADILGKGFALFSLTTLYHLGKFGLGTKPQNAVRSILDADFRS